LRCSVSLAISGRELVTTGNISVDLEIKSSNEALTAALPPGVLSDSVAGLDTVHSADAVSVGLAKWQGVLTS
jgi:hypothetical protein